MPPTCRANRPLIQSWPPTRFSEAAMLVKYTFDLLCRGCADVSHTGMWFLASVGVVLALQFAGINLLVMLLRSVLHLMGLLRRQ